MAADEVQMWTCYQLLAGNRWATSMQVALAAGRRRFNTYTTYVFHRQHGVLSPAGCSRLYDPGFACTLYLDTFVCHVLSSEPGCFCQCLLLNWLAPSICVLPSRHLISWAF